jgi:hypothetical protein
LYLGTVVRRKLKDRALLVAVMVKVLPLSRPSQLIRNNATVRRRPWGLLVGMEMTMLRPTVLLATILVLVDDLLMLGVGVPPGAELVVEGEGVLLGLGRLDMDSLG